MGGDHGPSEVVPGSLDHARAHPEDHVLLVGEPAAIRDHSGGELPSNVEIVAASQVIGMDEHPAMALREKKDSSITVACDLVKDGRKNDECADEQGDREDRPHISPGYPPQEPAKPGVAPSLQR